MCFSQVPLPRALCPGGGLVLLPLTGTPRCPWSSGSRASLCRGQRQLPTLERREWDPRDPQGVFILLLATFSSPAAEGSIAGSFWDLVRPAGWALVFAECGGVFLERTLQPSPRPGPQ